MIILKPVQSLNQNQLEEYRVEIKNGIEYFYKYCPAVSNVAHNR